MIPFWKRLDLTYANEYPKMRLWSNIFNIFLWTKAAILNMNIWTMFITVFGFFWPAIVATGLENKFLVICVNLLSFIQNAFKNFFFIYCITGFTVCRKGSLDVILCDTSLYLMLAVAYFDQCLGAAHSKRLRNLIFCYFC